jgi:hypothetical protein
MGNPDPDPGARKLRNFSGILPLKSYKIALTTGTFLGWIFLFGVKIKDELC